MTLHPRYDFGELLNGDETDAKTLQVWLLQSRARTLALTEDLKRERELGPKLAIVNPPLWELGHVAWFQEYWCLRYRNGAPAADSIISDADVIYNSAIAHHDTRWDLPLLTWRHMRDYQDAVLEQVLERLARGPLDTQFRYFVMLSILHEDMHGEAFHYTRQTHGYSKVGLSDIDMPTGFDLASDDIAFPGGAFLMGARRGQGFVFDNECWEHEVTVAPFRMSTMPVTVGAFSEFVRDNGYWINDYWSNEGREWRERTRTVLPRYWIERDGTVLMRDFDQWVSLMDRPHAPMLFVNAHEAEAYCRWAKRRLPTEAEWEFAARSQFVALQSIAQDSSTNDTESRIPLMQTPHEYIGWNWTTSAFTPYPGFSPGPYTEYSEPWFNDHLVLRGCSAVTQPRLRRVSYRNFYTADRNDVLAGFRTCASCL